MVPTFIIVLLFLAAFLLTYLQYFWMNAKRRVLNLRFALIVIALAGALSYNFFKYFHPDNRLASWLSLVLALVLIANAYRLLRRMPPREH